MSGCRRWSSKALAMPVSPERHQAFLGGLSNMGLLLLNGSSRGRGYWRAGSERRRAAVFGKARSRPF